MELFTPCKVNFDGARALELAPVCGMTRQNATAYALQAYGEDAGIQDDDSRHVEWVGAA